VKIKKTHTWRVRRRANGEFEHDQPKANMLVGNARGWAATLLGLPLDAVWFVNRDGRASRADKKIGTLRDEWFTPQK
jgi:hypothetical protein